MTHKVDIKIRRRKPNSSRGSVIKKGPVDSDIGEDEISRRRQSGTINFWDMGQVFEGGGWNDLSFSVAPTLNIDGFGVFTISAFPDSGWDDFRDLLLSPSPSLWESYYRKLGFEDAERYGVDFYDETNNKVYSAARAGSRYTADGVLVTGEGWTQAGMRLTGNPVSVFTVKSWGAFGSAFRLDRGDISTGAEYKVTQAPGFTETAVALPPLKGQNIKMFLPPRITQMVAVSSDTSTGDLEVVFGKFEALQRSWWLNRADSVWGVPLLTQAQGVNTFELGNQHSLLDTQVFPSGQEAKRVGPTWTLGSPGSYPTFADNFLEIGVLANPFNTAVYYVRGSLVAVLKIDTVFYYIWAQQDPLTQYTPVLRGIDLTF